MNNIILNIISLFIIGTFLVCFLFLVLEASTPNELFALTLVGFFSGIGLKELTKFINNEF